MKYLATFLLSSVVVALPATLESRQVIQDITVGSGCKDVTFIWVRGTTEAPNIGAIVGAGLLPEIRKKFPSLAVEGVTYAAGLFTNLRPDGADPEGVANAKKVYELAASKCPNTKIIGGGYSQGAAVTHLAIEGLSESVKSRIAGIVLYGDTRYTAEGGKIKGFPAEKVHNFCNGFGELSSVTPKDTICESHAIPQLALNAGPGGHLSYSPSYAPGAAWLAEQVAKAKGK